MFPKRTPKKEISISDLNNLPLHTLSDTSTTLTTQPSINVNVFSTHLTVSKSLFNATPSHTRTNSKAGYLNLLPTSTWQTVTAAYDQLEKIRKVLMNRNRTKEEAVILYKYLSNTKFFKDFRNNTELNDTDALLYACKYMEYEQVPIGKVIFKEEDDPSKKLYIILTGEVGIVGNIISNPAQVAQKSRKQSIYNTPSDRKQPKTSFDISSNASLSNFSQTPKRAQFFKKVESLPTNNNKALLNPKSMFQLKKADQFHRRNALKPNNVNHLLSDLGLFSFEDGQTMEEIQEKIYLQRKARLDLQVNYSQSNKEAPSSTTNSVIPSINLLLNEDIEETPEKEKTPQSVGSFKRFAKGDYLGKSVLTECREKSANVIATAPCELIVIKEEVFQHIYKRFEKSNTRKVNFILDHFPGLEELGANYVNEYIIHHFKETNLGLNSYITEQGKSSHEALYLLYEGICDVYLRLPEDAEYNEIQKYGEQEDQNRKDGILVCKISPGMFIGEEVLYNKNKKYEFTVNSASSSVQVLAISTEEFFKVFTKSTIQALKEIYEMKKEHYVSHGAERSRLKTLVMPLIKPQISKKLKVGKIVRKENGHQGESEVLNEINFNRTQPSPSPRKIELKNRIGNFPSIVISQQENPSIGLLTTPTKTPAALRTTKSIDLSKKGIFDFNEAIKNKRLDLGDGDRLPFTVKHQRKQTEGEEDRNRLKPNIPSLELNDLQQDSGRVVLTERIMRRLERSHSRSQRDGWENIPRTCREKSPVMMMTLQNERLETEEKEKESRVFLTQLNLGALSSSKKSVRRKVIVEKRVETEGNNSSFSNAEDLTTGSSTARTKPKLKLIVHKKTKTLFNDPKKNDYSLKKKRSITLKGSVTLLKEVSLETMFLSGFDKLI